MENGDYKPLFTKKTRAFVFGMQTKAVQGMLDFDFCCNRAEPSVAAMLNPFSSNHTQKFYWGSKEVLVPVYQHLEEACLKHPEVDVLINFASLRSAYDVTMACLEQPQVCWPGACAPAAR